MADEATPKPDQTGGLSTRGAIVAGVVAVSLVLTAALAGLFWSEIRLSYYRYKFPQMRRLKIELGKDWEIQIPRRDEWGGIHFYGYNKSLCFDPPAPKGIRHAILELYWWPLSPKGPPLETQTDGSMLSNEIGESDTHRLYGGVITPNGRTAILAGVRRAFGLRPNDE